MWEKLFKVIKLEPVELSRRLRSHQVLLFVIVAHSVTWCGRDIYLNCARQGPVTLHSRIFIVSSVWKKRKKRKKKSNPDSHHFTPLAPSPPPPHLHPISTVVFVWLGDVCPQWFLACAIKAHCCMLQIKENQLQQQYRNLQLNIQKDEDRKKTHKAMLQAKAALPPSDNVSVFCAGVTQKSSSIYRNICKSLLFFSTCKFVPYTLK